MQVDSKLLSVLLSFVNILYHKIMAFPLPKHVYILSLRVCHMFIEDRDHHSTLMQVCIEIIVIFIHHFPIYVEILIFFLHE